MKKLLFVILSLFAVVAYADNTITSKEYVDGQVSSLQTQIPAKNTNTVLTNTGTAGTIGEKAIYDTTAAYGTQSDALVTAAAFNSAMQNALESEFVCTEWQGDIHDNAHCLLYEVRGATQMQALPAGYTQLEYLESTGTQWIDTGVSPHSDNVIYKAKWLETELEVWTSLFGSTNEYNDPSYNRWPGTLYHPVAGGTYLATGGQASDGSCRQSNIIANQVNYVEIIINNGSLTKKQNGATCATTYVGSVQTNKDISLFRNVGYNNSVEQCLHTQLFYWQMYDNNVLARNFIPARRDSDGELGMYDLVSGTFFTNSGTGEFIAGPVASYLPQGN